MPTTRRRRARGRMTAPLSLALVDFLLDGRTRHPNDVPAAERDSYDQLSRIRCVAAGKGRGGLGRSWPGAAGRATAARPRGGPVTPADHALLAAVLAEVRGLRGDSARRAGRPDAEADARLVLVLAAAAGSRAFAATDVLRHATVDRELCAALEAAGLQAPRQIGQALRRVRGRAVGGFVVARIKRDERGALWTVVPAVSAIQHTEA